MAVLGHYSRVVFAEMEWYNTVWIWKMHGNFVQLKYDICQKEELSINVFDRNKCAGLAYLPHKYVIEESF